MIRLVIPLLAVAVVAWVLMFTLKPAMKKETWAGVRQAVTVTAFGLVVIGVVMLIFLLWGGGHG